MPVRDHLNREINLPETPRRIVSLCPSQTELLFSLGCGPQVVGRTQFCIHPEPEISQVKRIGGTKKVRYDRVKDLKPDFILAEKEENTPEIVEELSKLAPVYVTNVESYADALKMIGDVGGLLNREPEASELTGQIEAAFNEIEPLKQKRAAYFIWRNPYMVVGKQTYIQSILARCGFENVFLSKAGRYPELGAEDLKAAAPEFVLLSSEPYPFKDAHLEEFRELLPDAEVMLVDGEMFSWYGSRMAQAGAYLKRLTDELRNPESV